MKISKNELHKRQMLVLDTAFRLFVQESIETVTYSRIAQESGVPLPTVFRYYENKADLVIAVSTRAWYQYLHKVYNDRPMDYIKDIPAIDRLTFMLDLYLDMYKHHKDLLKFNDNFNHYITHENVEESRFSSYNDVVNPMRERLHLMYEKGKEDKTIRTDIPEAEFLRATAHSMMAACHHYAGGFIWGADEDKDHDYTAELLLLKEMILKFACEGAEAPKRTLHRGVENNILSLDLTQMVL